MIVDIFIFFVCGVLEDCLVTLYTVAVAKGQKATATISSVMITWFGILTLGLILDSLSFTNILDVVTNPRLWGFTLGNCVGVNIAMIWEPWLEKTINQLKERKRYVQPHVVSHTDVL